MLISPTEAVKIYDVSKPTLYKDMEGGKVSFEYDGRKKRRLNVAELERVYDKRKKAILSLTSKSVKNVKDLTEVDGKVASQVASNESVNDAIIHAKENEITLLKERIEELKEHNEDLKKYIEETREEHRGYMRLLEDKRKENDKTKIFQNQEQRMEDLMKAMEMMVNERHEQTKRMEELEKRMAKMKESGDRVLQKMNEKNRKLTREKQELEEEVNKSFWKKLVG